MLGFCFVLSISAALPVKTRSCKYDYSLVLDLVSPYLFIDAGLFSELEVGMHPSDYSPFVQECCSKLAWPISRRKCNVVWLCAWSHMFFFKRQNLKDSVFSVCDFAGRDLSTLHC